MASLAGDLDAQLKVLGLSGCEVKPEIVDEAGNPVSSDADPTVIYVNYPSVSSCTSLYVPSRVKIELICLSMDEPFELRSISSIINAHFPDDGESECALSSVLPSRDNFGKSIPAE